MTSLKKLKLYAAAIFLFAAYSSNLLHAEEIQDFDFGYSLDIPEGYTVSNHTEDGMSYLFTHEKLPVQFVLRLYPCDLYKDPQTALKGALSKLGEANDIEQFSWQGIPCSISNFEMTLNGKKYTGWGTASLLSEKETNLILLCYADSEYYRSCSQFIFSTLNSLAIGNIGLRTPGIIADCTYPKEGEQNIQLTIDGKIVSTKIDKRDSEAAEFVINCEYSVLKLYANSPKRQEAWLRYYRMIFRDSYGRLDKAAEDIYSAFTSDKTIRQNKEKLNLELNAKLLEWVQNFEYKRGTSGDSDFTNLIDCISGHGSDCDSRSLLMCVLLKHYGIKSALFISQIYSHAVYGADIKADGAKIKSGTTDFLLGETTAKGIKPGLIAQNMSETSNWITVSLP